MPRELTPAENARGKWAEDLYRLELVAARDRGEVLAFFRPEWFVIPAEAEAYIAEVKGQEAFEPPPFKGHGLPIRQVINYSGARVVLGVRTRLVVYDPKDHMRYSAWLDELEARGQSYIFDTSGNATGRRRVYDLSGFDAEPLAEDTAA